MSSVSINHWIKTQDTRWTFHYRIDEQNVLPRIKLFALWWKIEWKPTKTGSSTCMNSSRDRKLLILITVVSDSFHGNNNNKKVHPHTIHSFADNNNNGMCALTQLLKLFNIYRFQENEKPLFETRKFPDQCNWIRRKNFKLKSEFIWKLVTFSNSNDAS